MWWEIAATSTGVVVAMLALATVVYRAGRRDGAQATGDGHSEKERKRLELEVRTMREREASFREDLKSELHKSINEVKDAVAATMHGHTLEEEKLTSNVLTQLGSLNTRVDKVVTDVGYLRGTVDTMQQQQRAHLQAHTS